jgi:hypothetical protein
MKIQKNEPHVALAFVTRTNKRKIACAQAQYIHQLVSTRLVATHHGNNEEIPW